MRVEFSLPLTQLRQMFKTVQSTEPTQEHQHHRSPEKL